LGIVYAIQTIPVFLMVAIRFIIAGALLLAWCLLKGEKLPSLKSFGIMSVGGVLMLFVGNSAVVWAEQYISSGLAAIIVASVPLWFVILDKRQWSYYFSNKMIVIGLLIGFAGVLFLFGGKGAFNITGNKMNLLSFLVLTVGTISWAIGSLYSKYKSVEGSTTMKAAVQMLAAGIAAMLVAFLTKEHQNFSFSQISATSLIALIYLIVMGSLVAYMAYIWLLSVKPPSLVGTYAYVNPIVAVFLGWSIASEKISTQQIIALSVILAGVLLVNWSKDKKKTLGEEKTGTLQIKNVEVPSPQTNPR
jgi:drug/metabolite transporter (DMT)-like permease